MIDIHKKDHVWVVKWISSILMIFTMAFTAANIYPMNILLGLSASIGWTYVSLRWCDRALIVLNIIAVTVYLVGLLNHLYPTAKYLY